ncbi:hypothetical protein F5887DRAFT_898668 [Amanita rubescens]|nr:hypothetical protein F5887DRAFT_898668 [Amanita rubescens]
MGERDRTAGKVPNCSQAPNSGAKRVALRLAVSTPPVPVTEKLEVKHFPGDKAGMPIDQSAKGQSGFTAYQSRLSSSSGYTPFTSKVDWEVACWAKLHKISMAAVTELLQIEGVVEKLGLSYKNARELNKIIDRGLPGRPRFRRHDIRVGSETVVMYSRDIMECIKTLYGNPEFAAHLIHKPERHYRQFGDERTRIYHDMHTGAWWWEMQTVLEARKPGATIIPLIFSSDRTQVTLFGNKTVYPVYLTIGNLPKDIRRKPSRHGQILVAYLPTTKLKLITNQAARRRMISNLFHSCLHHLMEPLIEVGLNGTKMADGMGVVRRVHPLLAVYVGDYPEQVLVANIKSGECPKCDVARDKLGDTGSSELRNIQAVYDALAMVSGDYRDFKQACKQVRIKPIAQPFWGQLPFLDIFQAITPDILHQLHQGVFKHLVSWLVQAFGSTKIDARCQRLIPSHNVRIFSGGISGLSRVTGKEHSMISRVILGVIADMGLPSGLDTSRLLRAVRALLDFMYLAQLPVISTQHLALLNTALDMFHQNKNIFIDLGIRETFNIPKLHACFHYAHSMMLFGSTDNYDTQHTERLHIDFTKTAYRATNSRDELPQMTTWLERREQVYQFAAYIAWRHQRHGDNQSTPSLPLLPLPARYVKMTRYPSVKSVSIDNLQTKYGAEFFLAAFARFIVLQRNPQVTRAHLEQDILDIHIPFTSVSVYYSIRYQDNDGSGTVDSIRIRPHKNDNKGRKLVDGRFDTGLVHTKEDGRIGIHAYRVAQIRVIFSINPTARKLLFGDSNHPPHHLAYVEWFTPFQRAPDPKTGLYKVSRSFQQNARVASIVPVTDISQSIHLSPILGRSMPREWNSHTVLEECNTFLVNPFTDYRTYLLFHSSL